MSSDEVVGSGNEVGRPQHPQSLRLTPPPLPPTIVSMSKSATRTTRRWATNPTANYSSPEEIEAAFQAVAGKGGKANLGIIRVPPRELLERARAVSRETLDRTCPFQA